MQTRALRIAALAAALLLPLNAVAQKVFINPSNQIHNAVAGGGNEATYASINANITRDILVANSFDVRVDDDFDNAPLRANSWGAAVFLSVHSNAGGGHGPETLYGVPSGSQTFSGKIQNGLVAKLPFYNRGLKDGTWTYVLRTANMPGALAEVVFHDCSTTSHTGTYTVGHPPSESAYLKSSSGQQAIGSGLANGVCQHFRGSNCSGGSSPANGSIKGVVYKNGDLEDHVAPATVTLNTGAMTTYNGSAVWSFDVPPGNYSITASAPGYQTATRTCPAVTSGQISWCSIELVPAASSQKGFIKGVVYKNGDLTDHVFPATVSLNNGASTTYDGSAVWSFEVNPGTYTVTASASGYQTATRSDCSPVVAGETTWCSIEVVAQEPPPQKGFLKGVVYQNGNTNSHVAPATVTLGTGQSTTYTGTADWSFELAPGSYTVTVSANGYETATKSCPQPVVAGQTSRCDVELVRIPEPAPDAGTIEPEPDAGEEPEPDAGEEPPLDAGVVEPEDDAGVPPPVDAGTEPGPRTVPEIDGGACGCSSTSSGLFGLLALPLFAAGRLRRRRGR